MNRRTLLLLLCLAPAITPAATDEPFDYHLKDLDGDLHRASNHRGQWLHQTLDYVSPEEYETNAGVYQINCPRDSVQISLTLP